MTEKNNYLTDTKVLNLVIDLVARIHLAFKKGLKDYTRQLLAEIISKYRVVFFELNRYGEISGDSLFRPLDDASKNIEEAINANEAVVCFYHPENRLNLKLMLSELINFLSWEKELVVEKLIRPALQQFIKQHTPGTQEVSHNSANTTLDVCRNFIPADDSLARDIEIWMIKHYVRNIEQTNRARAICGASTNPGETFVLTGLDPVVDRLLELGITREEICEEFLASARRANKLYAICLMLPYIGAKCFHDGHPELYKFLADECIPLQWQLFLNNPSSSRFWEFKKLLIFRILDRGGNNSKPIRELFEGQLIGLLSRGQLTFAWQLCLALGSDVMGYVERSGQSRIKKSREYFMSLLPSAFDRAYRDSRYGIATALVLQFGADACKSDIENNHDRIAAVAELARDFNQPICFSNPLTYLHLDDWED